jgi:hypothetical protein
VKRGGSLSFLTIFTFPTSVQPISITKTLLIVPTKNERDPPLFNGKLLIKFQNILRNTTQVIIRHRVKILASNSQKSMLNFKANILLCTQLALSVYSTTFNNFSVISWQSVLMVEEPRFHRDDYKNGLTCRKILTDLALSHTLYPFDKRSRRYCHYFVSTVVCKLFTLELDALQLHFLIKY